MASLHKPVGLMHQAMAEMHHAIMVMYHAILVMLNMDIIAGGGCWCFGVEWSDFSILSSSLAFARPCNKGKNCKKFPHCKCLSCSKIRMPQEKWISKKVGALLPRPGIVIMKIMSRWPAGDRSDEIACPLRNWIRPWRKRQNVWAVCLRRPWRILELEAGRYRC